MRLSARPKAPCRIHLFAATRYRLRVNGRVVGHGPARFDPSSPEYDTHDIAPWLVEGGNILLVEVNAFGATSFQSVPGPGVFIAWGGADAGLDFSTPGEWRAARASAWDENAASWSFAQGPVEILDHRLLPATAKRFEAAHPLPDRPAPAVRPESWGPLRTRSIPAASLDPLRPAKILFSAPLSNPPRAGFRVAENYRGRGHRYACAAFIHSPHAQIVEIQLFWGPYFLNGDALSPTSDQGAGNRLAYAAALRPGWNLLCGFPEALHFGWAQMISWPGDAGVKVRAAPEEACPHVLRHTEALHAELFRSLMNRPPTNQTELEAISLPWRHVSPGALPAAPCLVMAWDRYGPSASRGPASFPFAMPAAEAAVVFDFGREFLGYVALDLSAPPGTTVDFAYGEALRPDGTLRLLDRHNIHTADRQITAAPRQLLEGFHPRGGRYLQITVRAAAPATINSLVIRSANLPDPEAGPFFGCSDPVLSRAWAMGRDTLLVSREDAWLDCPLRERGSYIGDGLVQSRAFAPLAAEDPLTDRCLRLWATGQRPDGQLVENHPSNHQDGLADYTLLFIHLLHERWARTGDLTLARELFPVIRRIFSGTYWHAAPSGLWHADHARLFIDWAVPAEARRGESGALNAFRHRALLLAADLSDRLGLDAGPAWRLEAARVREYFQTLWDPAAGAYAGSRIDGELCAGGRLHANLLALAYDLVPPGRDASVLAYVRDRVGRNHLGRGDHIELYFHHFAAQALYHRGLAAEAEALFRESHRIMQENGAWTLWECLRRDSAGAASLCHAWSASFNWVAAERILGVRPADPGRTDHLLIAPESETLDWAEGAVAHPRGLVRVSWRVVGRELSLHVSAPLGVSYQVAPRGRLGALRLSAVPTPARQGGAWFAPQSFAPDQRPATTIRTSSPALEPAPNHPR